MSFMHGITITEASDGARALVTVATAVIGLVATAADADAAAFPLRHHSQSAPDRAEPI